MSLFGAIIGGIAGGPIGWIVGDQLSGPEHSVGTRVDSETPSFGPAKAPPPPFTGQGTSGDDVVHISMVRNGDIKQYFVEINGELYTVSKEQLESTVFDLGGGDDKLIVDPNVDANITARGGNGDDLMIGGGGDDRFDGGSGDDRLIGRDGNDTLKGGSGDDYLRGDRGRDDLDGGGGTNTVLRDMADVNAEFVLRSPQSLAHAGTVTSVTISEPRRYGG